MCAMMDLQNFYMFFWSKKKNSICFFNAKNTKDANMQAFNSDGCFFSLSSNLNTAEFGMCRNRDEQLVIKSLS